MRKGAKAPATEARFVCRISAAAERLQTLLETHPDRRAWRALDELEGRIKQLTDEAQRAALGQGPR